jgi:hypothetical protein
MYQEVLDDLELEAQSNRHLLSLASRRIRISRAIREERRTLFAWHI